MLACSNLLLHREVESSRDVKHLTSYLERSFSSTICWFLWTIDLTSLFSTSWIEQKFGSKELWPLSHNLLILKRSSCKPWTCRPYQYEGMKYQYCLLWWSYPSHYHPRCFSPSTLDRNAKYEMFPVMCLAHPLSWHHFLYLSWLSMK